MNRMPAGPRRSGAVKSAIMPVFAVLLFCTAASIRDVWAEDARVNLKVSIWLPPTHPVVASAMEWLASIEKASGGSIKGTVFPSEQLGKAFDHYDMARDGIADVT